jgi:hypothetical protein
MALGIELRGRAQDRLRDDPLGTLEQVREELLKLRCETWVPGALGITSVFFEVSQSRSQRTRSGAHLGEGPAGAALGRSADLEWE